MAPGTLPHAALVFWVAFGISAAAAYPIYRLLLAMKSRQTVSQYAPEGHQTKQGTPTMGGLIILVGLIAGLCVSTNGLPEGFTLPAPARYHYYYFDPSVHGWQVNVFLPLLVLAFGLIGFIDDFLVPRLMKGKRGLGWKQKILMQVGAGLLAVPALYLPFTAANAAIVVVVVLFFSNAYNFADGLDGLAGSLGIVLFGGLGVLGLVLGHPGLMLCLAAVGAILPFLFLNAPPAKVFMGDVGSLPIGALLGVAVLRLFVSGSGMTMQLDASYPALLTAGLISLVMVAELVPVPMQIFWVKVFKRRLFPYTPIHHAFENAGWKETRVVFVFGIVQALCVAAAITAALMMRPVGPNGAWTFYTPYSSIHADQ